jgi:hypothetical protein
MADALDAKSSKGNYVWVQAPPPVPKNAFVMRFSFTESVFNIYLPVCVNCTPNLVIEIHHSCRK